MADYFAFDKECILVNGAVNAAIYDLRDGIGHIYSLNSDSKNFVNLIYNGKSVRESTRTLNQSEHDAEEFLNKFIKLGMGNYSDVPIIGTDYKKFEQPAPDLGLAWLEIWQGCNERCSHCYVDTETGKREKIINPLTHSDWIRVIHEVSDAGYRDVQFIGGEPLLYGSNDEKGDGRFDKLFDLIRIARYCDRRIEVFTNGTLLNDYVVQKFKDFDVSAAVSIYSNNPDVHDAITHLPGSFHATVNGMRLLKKYDIPLRAGVIAMKLNQDTMKETIQFLRKEFGLENAGYDIVRPSGRGCKNALIPEKLVEGHALKEDIFSRLSKYEFIMNLHYHNCWGGRINVTESGDVYPCIMEHDAVLGNVKTQSIREIIESQEANKIQKLTNDYIESCKVCEYRYNCHDCRPKAKGSTKNLYIKPYYCFYEPETGEWKPFKIEQMMNPEGLELKKL